MSKYFYKAIDEFRESIAGAKISLFLDYDGTLTPIVGRPERAQLSYITKDLLRRLKTRYPVSIISGRAVDELRELVNISGIVYAGNHGLEIYSEKMAFCVENAEEIRRLIKRISTKLRSALQDFRGVIVEDKGLTLTIHYRLVDKKDVSGVIKRIECMLSPYLEADKLWITEGKKVLEVRPPVDWDKGKAVMWILEKIGLEDSIPIYIGDDETDRDAFRALKGIGISIVVAHRWNDVNYFLKEQKEVNGFLKMLASV